MNVMLYIGGQTGASYVHSLLTIYINFVLFALYFVFCVLMQAVCVC